MKSVTAPDLIRQLDLKPHPEGGFYRETYRAGEIIARRALPQRFSGDRHFSTAIFFLLPQGTCSRLHRIKADEIWHFYLGGPLHLVQIDSAGETQEITLGQNLAGDQVLQHVVPAGCWFGAYPEDGIVFSLVGCTVAPGFDFADFELGNRQQLWQQFPGARKLIERLT